MKEGYLSTTTHQWNILCISYTFSVVLILSSNSKYLCWNVEEYTVHVQPVSN